MQDDDPGRLRDLSARLLRFGRFAEAAEALERVLAHRPDIADCWYNLGYCQQQLRQFGAALASYDQALRRGIGGPEEVHVNRAAVFAGHLNRLEDAEVELAAALRFDPNYVPALLNLGNIAEQRGDRTVAQSSYEKVLDIDPLNALALGRLPGLVCVGGAGDPLVARIEQALARPEIAPTEKADLGFGLGKALDSAGAYDKAFAAYTEANLASRASAGPGGVRYDARQHERRVDSLIRFFPAPVPPAAKDAKHDSAPIFICGMFRSGSSLVEQILASHFQVTAGGEIDLLPFIARSYLEPCLEANRAPDEESLERMRSLYLGGISSRMPSVGFITDKRPDNFLYIGLIKQLFPAAKIVHTKRNSIDNCLSVFFLHLSHAMPYALDLLDIAHWHKQYRKLMAHWKSAFPESIHDVDYDDLIVSPKSEIEDLLDACGLPWDDSCMSFHKTRTVVATPSAWQVRQPLYTRSSGRWRNYARHLDGLLAALAE